MFLGNMAKMSSLSPEQAGWLEESSRRFERFCKIRRLVLTAVEVLVFQTHCQSI